MCCAELCDYFMFWYEVLCKPSLGSPEGLSVQLAGSRDIFLLLSAHQGSPQQIIGFHLTLYSASSPLTPTTVISCPLLANPSCLLSPLSLSTKPHVFSPFNQFKKQEMVEANLLSHAVKSFHIGINCT